MEYFFPQIQVKTKKKVFIKNSTYFPKFTLRCTPIQIIGEMQMWTILKLLGGYTAKLLGGNILCMV